MALRADFTYTFPDSTNPTGGRDLPPEPVAVPIPVKRRPITKNRSRAKSLAGFRVLSLFSGTGIDHVAVEELGGEHVGMCENNKAARETIIRNFPSIAGKAFPKDICAFQAVDTPDHELLIATFPCQPFSIAGKQDGFKDKKKGGRLIFEVLRLVAAKMPKVVLLENVPRFATIDGGKSILRLTREFRRLGYEFSHKVLNAADFGVPQQRRRLFMVAVRKDVMRNSGEAFKFPEGKAPLRTVASILEPGILASIPMSRITKTAKNSTARKDKPARTVKPARKDRSARVGFVDGNPFQGARVYSTDSVGIALTASSGGLGGSSGLYLVEGGARKLTPLECARMQGFPDSYKRHPSDGQARKQFGNAVALPVIKAILEAIGRQLLGGEAHAAVEARNLVERSKDQGAHEKRQRTVPAVTHEVTMAKPRRKTAPLPALAKPSAHAAGKRAGVKKSRAQVATHRDRLGRFAAIRSLTTSPPKQSKRVWNTVSRATCSNSFTRRRWRSRRARIWNAAASRPYRAPPFRRCRESHAVCQNIFFQNKRDIQRRTL